MTGLLPDRVLWTATVSQVRLVQVSPRSIYALIAAYSPGCQSIVKKTQHHLFKVVTFSPSPSSVDKCLVVLLTTNTPRNLDAKGQKIVALFTAGRPDILAKSLESVDDGERGEVHYLAGHEVRGHSIGMRSSRGFAVPTGGDIRAVGGDDAKVAQ